MTRVNQPGGRGLAADKDGSLTGELREAVGSDRGRRRKGSHTSSSLRREEPPNNALRSGRSDRGAGGRAQYTAPGKRGDGSHLATQPHTMTDTAQDATMERILQEITAVGHRHEGMDSAITSLTAETKSTRLDIAGFQSRVTGLEQRVSTMEDHINTAQDRDQELLYLQTRAHGPFRREGYEVLIRADFSKETNDRRKAFLALRPRLRQLGMKYGLFERARIWITDNGVSKDFYEP
ncbi:hypothetical protein NDU88_001414 [Pleurodeles waltl]|uniref:Uncharacterized protein n=1 Tax=Pleurodeles waltl TaxID=8319 RepID=A0AAV7TI94_PLEWA|nr:hypothetical protein NDU88_001414 [Pleurodeles waltl]